MAKVIKRAIAIVASFVIGVVSAKAMKWVARKLAKWAEK